MRAVLPLVAGVGRRRSPGGTVALVLFSEWSVRDFSFLGVMRSIVFSHKEVGKYSCFTPGRGPSFRQLWPDLGIQSGFRCPVLGIHS